MSARQRALLFRVRTTALAEYLHAVTVADRIEAALVLWAIDMARGASL